MLVKPITTGGAVPGERLFFSGVDIPGLLFVREFDLNVHADRRPYLQTILSAGEQERANSIASRKFADLFVLRRGIVRETIGDAMGIEAARLDISRTRYGKPFVNGIGSEKSLVGNGPCRFSVSHKGQSLIIAVALREVGVDMETMDGKTERIAHIASSKDEQVALSLLAVNKRRSGFLKAWVQKEAISKNRGLGMAFDFGSTSVPVSPVEADEDYILGFPGCLERIRVVFRARTSSMAALAITI